MGRIHNRLARNVTGGLPDVCTFRTFHTFRTTGNLLRTVGTLGAGNSTESSIGKVREADIVRYVTERALEPLKRGERAAVNLPALVEEHQPEAADHAVASPHLFVGAASTSKQTDLRRVGKQNIFSACARLM